MRLAAQQKMGYYPVKPGTIELLCKSLTVSDPANTTIFDPCCGKGMALGQLGDLLKVPLVNRYGIELDSGRAKEAEAHGTILNASFFGTKIVSTQSFSIAWVNPPYEDEIRDSADAGRKLEQSFIDHVARFVAHHGIMVLHMPDDRLTRHIQHIFFENCYDCHKINLPAELRPFRETLLIGKRRPILGETHRESNIKYVDTIPPMVVPPGKRLKSFTQTTPTDEAIDAAINSARFMRVFTFKPKREPLKPILPLGAGHLGLTLASGLLDGYFAPPGFEPHVVRGIAYKENELAKTEETTDEEGETKTKIETYRENIKLKIRAITSNGLITDIK
jgi:Uncharacterised methyltransferase family (DUF6094)